MSAFPALSQALAERYVVERELGAGGMATVWLARDLKHDRMVAIKVLRAELAESVGAERFLREIVTTANLRHPHILPLYDSGEAAGFLYYVMPLVEGETLRDRLARERQLPLDAALQIAREVADALEYAHLRGVVHRDIKPENILLESGHAVVADFGIARALRAAGSESITRTGVTVGTPTYMSPEQAAGDGDLDGRSDLYSLACVTFEMLAGQPPFTGPTVESITRQHVLADPPRITNLRSAVPAAVAAALSQAMAKNPEDRFDTPSQFAASLQSSTEAAPPSATGRRARRGRIRILGVAAALVAVAVTALALRARGSAASADTAGVASIAVLPFTDLSPDQTSAYLGDGIAETLINALSNVAGVQVTGRTSAFQFRENRADLKEIGGRLGVANVLDGSVQRSGDVLRITAQLLRTSDGRSLWSKNFDRAASDIFTVQDEVARAVVDALQARLLLRGNAATGIEGTRSTAAYDAYLLGRFHWNRRTTEGMQRAIAAFSDAIRADSSYAQAWSGLADAYSLYTASEYGPPGIDSDSIVKLAERAARRAVALNAELGESHISLGQVLEARQRWEEAERAYERGVELSPGYATGHQWYAYFLQARNRWDDALREMEIARRLEPLSHIIVVSMASVYDAVGRYDDAEPVYEQGLALAPDAWWSMMMFCEHVRATQGGDGLPGCYRRLALAVGRDSAHAAAMERGLRDPARRDSMIDVMVREENPITVVPLLRHYRSDDAAAAYVLSLPDRAHADFNKSMFAAVLGPTLRADARVRTTLVRLGYPPWDSPK